jgi:hypothetical protein
VNDILAGAPLPSSQLNLEIQADGTRYFCTGRSPVKLTARGLPVSPLDFPVRIIESGRFFQKFTLHDLEFRTQSGKRLMADARLEVSAWPDRLALVLVVRPKETLRSARIILQLQTPMGLAESARDSAATWREQAEQRAILAVAAASGALPKPGDVVVRVAPADPAGHATVSWNAEELASSIRLETPQWQPPGPYPESMLDQWESHSVTVENRSERAEKIGLNFDYAPTRSLVAYVPMILDAGGRPSGAPVQISKNWHQPASHAPLDYMGYWEHGRTWLNLPANSRVTFTYGTTFARWGGVPTASVAQLSLVGWGHNGFWDEFALGAFGESICFQPGRVLRRALLTDFRPLFQQGYANDERWAWTANAGGGDTMVRLDRNGRYVPFKRNVTRIASHGPNLAHLIYDEVSDDDAIRSHVEVYLPRSDDCVRVFLRIHYDVLRRVEFSRLALFQLGADFYNEPDAPLIAWGNAAGLAAEQRPAVKPASRLLPEWEARGEQPWLSLHGETRSDHAETGQASRGLIVREWHANLGGRNVPFPTFAAVGSRGPKPHLAGEIVPPPNLATLLPGDSVEMLVEILPIPLTAERYYGANESFAAALRESANTWGMVQREAAGNRPSLRKVDAPESPTWPLVVPVGCAPEVTFSLRGGLGWLPVRFVDLDRPDITDLWEASPSGEKRVQQGNADRAFWQCDYDEPTGHWSLTYNLPSSAEAKTYVVKRRATAP